MLHCICRDLHYIIRDGGGRTMWLVFCGKFKCSLLDLRFFPNVLPIFSPLTTGGFAFALLCFSFLIFLFVIVYYFCYSLPCQYLNLPCWLFCITEAAPNNGKIVYIVKERAKRTRQQPQQKQRREREIHLGNCSATEAHNFPQHVPSGSGRLGGGAWGLK